MGLKALKTGDDFMDEPESERFDDENLPKKSLFRIDEVAEYLSVSDRTIRLWIDHGHFQVEKLHGTLRITRESILSFRLKSRVKFS